MDSLDSEDRRIIGIIETKPFRLYSSTEFLPTAKKQATLKLDTLREIEQTLNHLNDLKIVYKMAVQGRTYYFSPKAEIES